VTTTLHKAQGADQRLTESSCVVCGGLVRRVVTAAGTGWAHRDGHIVSSAPPLRPLSPEATGLIVRGPDGP